MLRSRPLSIAASFFSLACTCIILQPTTADAQTISLSLNVFYSTPSNPNSGGTWELVAKSSNLGIAGLQTHISNISNAFDDAPFGIVNNQDPAGFYQGDAIFFIPPSGSTPGFYELDFGQTPVDSLGPGEEQGAFYGVGQLANGAPNYPGKPAGSNSEGPALNSLSQTFGIPWGTSDILGDPTWSTAAVFAAGDFSAGVTPAFVSGNNNGNVFTALGTSTTFGTVAPATVSTIVRTNFAVLTADYNHNGVVDMADYVLWRDTLNQVVTAGSGADGSGNGIVDQADYSVWRAHFGNGSGPGAGSGSLSTSAVPEPYSGLLLTVASIVCCFVTRSRRLCRAVVASPSSVRAIAPNGVQWKSSEVIVFCAKRS